MTTATNTKSFRERTGRNIVLLHTSLLVLAIIFYFLKGFDMEEIMALFAILAPVTALYGGIAFRSLHSAKEEPTKNHHIPHANTIRWLIWGHFIVIGLLISLQALVPNILNFKEMTFFLGLIEVYFGAHIGSLLHEIFGK